MVWKNRGWLHLISCAGDDISGFWKSKTENPQDCVFFPLLNLSQSMQRDDHAFAAFIFFLKITTIGLEIIPRLQFQPIPFLLQSNRGIEIRLCLLKFWDRINFEFVKFEELRKLLPWGIKKYLLVLAHDVKLTLCPRKNSYS